MARFVTRRSAKEYLDELRRHVRLFPRLEGDCFSGLVIGGFFSVAYRTYYEWDRRNNYGCARTIGFVRQKDGQSVVSYVTVSGLLSPAWILLFSAASFIPLYFGLSGNLILMAFVALLIGTVICAGTAFYESMTERGEDALKTIQRFVRNPSYFVGHVKNH